MFDIQGTLVESFDFDDECFVQAIENVLGIKVDSDWSKYANVSDPGILDEIIEANDIAVDRDLVHKDVKARLRNYLATYLDLYKLKQIEGTGLSAAYPPVWENQITIQLECDDRFEAGMAFYIHASMQSMDDRTGMLLGGSFLMTLNGPERLDKASLELIVIDG